MSNMLRYHGQETNLILQSTTMPDKVMEVTLSPAVAIPRKLQSVGDVE